MVEYVEIPPGIVARHCGDNARAKRREHDEDAVLLAWSRLALLQSLAFCQLLVRHGIAL